MAGLGFLNLRRKARTISTTFEDADNTQADAGSLGKRPRTGAEAHLRRKPKRLGLILMLWFHPGETMMCVGIA